jgi:hypothetical protein
MYTHYLCREASTGKIRFKTTRDDVSVGDEVRDEDKDPIGPWRVVYIFSDEYQKRLNEIYVQNLPSPASGTMGVIWHIVEMIEMVRDSD